MEHSNSKENIIVFLRKITSQPLWLWIVVPVITPFLILFIGLTLAFSNFFGMFEKGFPTDAEMKSTFYENQDAFEKLRLMSNEDSDIARIVNNSEESKPNSITNERWEDYKHIFNKLGLSKGIGRGNSNDLYLHVYMRTGQKGYIYSEEKLEPEVETLDNRDILQEKSFVCKKLNDNWYIYLARMPD